MYTCGGGETVITSKYINADREAEGPKLLHPSREEATILGEGLKWHTPSPTLKE